MAREQVNDWEREAVRKARRGDRDAFGALFDAYREYGSYGVAV